MYLSSTMVSVKYTSGDQCIWFHIPSHWIILHIRSTYIVLSVWHPIRNIIMSPHQQPLPPCSHKVESFHQWSPKFRHIELQYYIVDHTTASCNQIWHSPNHVTCIHYTIRRTTQQQPRKLAHTQIDNPSVHFKLLNLLIVLRLVLKSRTSSEARQEQLTASL
jgi:hypothetical protein